MPTLILQTPRLLLRRLLPEDAPILAALWTDPDVTRHMGGPREFERVRAGIEERALAGHPDRYDLWPLVEKESGGVIGHCGLLEKDVDGVEEVEVCYVIAAGHWGKGYATEIASALLAYATSALERGRIIALIDPENVASEVVAKKIGMRHDRDTVRPSGKTLRVYVAIDD